MVLTFPVWNTPKRPKSTFRHYHYGPLKTSLLMNGSYRGPVEQEQRGHPIRWRHHFCWLIECYSMQILSKYTIGVYSNLTTSGMQWNTSRKCINISCVRRDYKLTQVNDGCHAKNRRLVAASKVCIKDADDVIDPLSTSVSITGFINARSSVPSK